MTRYIPHTGEDEQKMLADMGLAQLSELFSEIPADLMLEKEPDLGPALSEYELQGYFKQLAQRNISGDDAAIFLGGGSYDHYVPAVVAALSGRAEFSTAYTPYQPEISQGTLQAIFEFQSYICQLTGLAVSNASMYDGAMSLAEAVLMARAHTRRDHVLVAGSINPNYLMTINTYCIPHGIQLDLIPYNKETGQLDIPAIKDALQENTAALVISLPSFHGIMQEELTEIAELMHINKSLLVVNWDPTAAGLYKTPGSFGADIVTGEAQSLGQALNFGGPYLGFIAVTDKLLRRLPGRIVGLTEDKEGNRAYVLTLQAREQHIRRDKATSNICTNQGLNALQAVVYLAFMGESGLREVAKQSYNKAHYLHDALLESGAWKKRFNAPFYKEFSLNYLGDTKQLNQALLEAGIIGGLRLARVGEEEDAYLIAVTEKRSLAQLDRFVEISKEVYINDKGGIA